MKISVLTLFPDIYKIYLDQTILKRANIEYEIINIRDYADNKYKKVDDKIYGDGAGMLLKPEPFFKYFASIKERKKSAYTVFLSPQGKKVDQSTIEFLKEKKDIIFISGRYEGLDQRVIDRFVDLELCTNDFVLTSGDLPCLSLIDAISRQLDGVINEDSYKTDSFYNGLLGYSQYTKPVKISRFSVPDILLSGDHKKIQEYRFVDSLKKTMINRPELFYEKIKTDEEFRKKVEKIYEKVSDFFSNI